MRSERATCRANVLMAGVITDASTLTRPASPTGYRRRNRTDRSADYQNRHRDLNEEHHPLPRSLPLSVVLPSGLPLSAVGKKFASVIPEISSSLRDGRSSARACLLPRPGALKFACPSRPALCFCRRLFGACPSIVTLQGAGVFRCPLAHSPFRLEMSDGLLMMMMMTMKAARR